MSLKSTLCLPAVVCLFVVPHLEAQQPNWSRFNEWDKNSDGKLSLEEVPGPLRKNFARIDADQDGFISREEDAKVERKPGNPGGNGPAAPEGVKTLADIDYAGSANPRQMLDLYLPEMRAGEGPLPVLVFIHGGGWQAGDKSSGGGKVMPYVAEGKFAGVSVGYRLSDEAQWPSQIHDCKAAIRWIKGNAAEYGLDPERIVVWGSSAGGHLVAMLGVSDGVKELEGTIGAHLDQNGKVHSVIDFFGPTEMLTMGDHESTIPHNAPDSPESKLIGGALQENPEKAKSASPIEHVTADDSPYLIVHGTEDPLVPYPQSVDFEKRLESVGVPVTLLTVEGGGHGKGFGKTVNEVVTAFLEKQVLGGTADIPDRTVKAGE
jgi:acetyl esterase/lipase